MRRVDQQLCRAWPLALEDISDPVEEELSKLLPFLIDAGYVRTYGHTRTGFLWHFTSLGVGRVEKLGCD